MGNEEPGTQGESQPIGYAPQYAYGAQWFDDMGSLSLAFPESPATAMDVGMAGLSRAEISKFASALSVNMGATYDEGGIQ